MRDHKSTKKALLTSVLCLLLCCSMLIGATFAWFTDEVVSGMNQIVAGIRVKLSHDKLGCMLSGLGDLFSKK